MFISDIPPEMPINEAVIMCSVEASNRYNIPLEVIFAVATTEGGKPELRVKNPNNTEDLGIMQFNTAYLKTLSHYGIKEADVLKSTCYSFHLAAWRIANHLQEDFTGDMWTKVALYHSRTPAFRDRYRAKLLENVQLLDYELAYKYKKILVNKQIFFEKSQKQQQHSIVFNPVVDDFTQALLALESSDLVIIPAKEH